MHSFNRAKSAWKGAYFLKNKRLPDHIVCINSKIMVSRHKIMKKALYSAELKREISVSCLSLAFEFRCPWLISLAWSRNSNCHSVYGSSLLVSHEDMDWNANDCWFPSTWSCSMVRNGFVVTGSFWMDPEFGLFSSFVLKCANLRWNSQMFIAISWRRSTKRPVNRKISGFNRTQYDSGMFD